MTDHLHPKRESYPLINTDDEFVAVFRSHLTIPATPYLYVKALTAAEIRLDRSKSLDDRIGYEVLDYTAGGTDTITITVNGGGSTVLTEGTDFDAVVSNEETALQIAAAINTAAISLVATADGTKVYIAPEANSGIKHIALTSGDIAAWTPDTLAYNGTVLTLAAQQTQEIGLYGRDPLDTVVFLRILKGKVSLDLRSPVECRTYLRQPATLSGNTGHPGGWPTSP